MTGATVLLAVAILAGCGGGGAASDGGPGGDADAGPEPTGPRLGEILVNELRPVAGGDGAEVQWGAISVGFWDGEWPTWHRVTATEGPCVLEQPFPPAACDSCAGICIGPGQCLPYPRGVSGGTVTLGGLAIPSELATLNPESDGAGGWWYRYGQAGSGTSWEGPPNVFDPGRTITAASTGATVPAFALTATGVAAIAPDLPNGLATFTPGQAFTLRWSPSPGSGNARVHVTINSSNTFHGEPLPVIIECDVPDAAGELTIPASMIDAFPESDGLEACVRRDCPPSVLRRYTRATADVPGGHVELVVADELFFGVVHQP